MTNRDGYETSQISMTDITDRKRAEDKAEDSESRYQFLAESMADVVFTLALDLTTTYVSPSVEKMPGIQPGRKDGCNP